MKKRYHLFIIIGILLVGLVVGSFLDLQINEALFQPFDSFLGGFGLVMASFGVYPAYAGLAFIGGGLLATTIFNKNLHKGFKILGIALACIAYPMAVYLAARELPSVNGYDNESLTFLSYAIAAVVFGGVFVGAIFVCKKGDLWQLYKILIVMAVIFTVGLLPPGFLIKLVIHRPRYRFAVQYGACNFKNWWEMFPEYKELIGTTWGGHILTKEEFKSFPSGHSGQGMIMTMFLAFLPYFFPKLKGKEVPLFYIGAGFGFLMMLSRILVGAHYLTDTCMGSLLLMIVFYVCNEFAYRKKFFDDPVIAPAEPVKPVDEVPAE